MSYIVPIVRTFRHPTQYIGMVANVQKVVVAEHLALDLYVSNMHMYLHVALIVSVGNSYCILSSSNQFHILITSACTLLNTCIYVGILTSQHRVSEALRSVLRHSSKV